MTEVIMPKMGDGMEEGTLLEWLKKEGDKVKSGEVIGTIQTDKATLELEAPGSGVLQGFLIQAGATVPVGKPIAAIVKDGEALPDGWGSANGAAKAAATTAAAPATAASTAPAAEATAAPVPVGRINASPLAKKVAAELGLDLSSITGSGPNGRIIEKDVRGAKPVPAAPAPVSAPAPTVVATAEDTVVPLTKLKSITAARTLQSKQQVPHFYVTVEVDIEKIVALRAQFEAEASGKVSINDFVVKAVAKALVDLPEVNATFTGNSITRFGAVHIGIAAAVDEGLTVPVLRNAQALSLRDISGRTKDLVQRARTNKLTLDELSGSTFSISNMGMLNVDNFIAIVNQPNAGILAVASARKKVVVNDQDEIEVRQKMNISCSFDHRVVDGARGAVFINAVKDYLENPTRLLG